MWVELSFLSMSFRTILKDIVVHLSRVIWFKYNVDKFSNLQVHPRVCVEVDYKKLLQEDIRLFSLGFELV